ncbi:matrixin family metalloprotease [Lacticaseibacillus jixianensis]|uniref:Matrixin family metalloprotease n=1 Tax=Lacticaseibacillus jixianensis TaxID=2486012 RepID=A0ABW4B929_9LACO|nr:matrixin family metalloprotease [Lacticaseibacillus jixianensis]
MRHKGILTALTVMIAGFAIYSQASPLPSATRRAAQDAVQAGVTWATATGARLADAATKRLGLANRTPASQAATATPPSAPAQTGATPIEAAVKGIKLSSRYTYSFEPGTPARVRTAFTQAATIYNRAGVVTLTPGASSTFGNHITFGTYTKPIPDDQPTVELGEGGPAVIYSKLSRTGVNHAKAEFNAAYQGAVKVSVALHEIGHALGLGHSGRRTSVMYPMDEGRTGLAPADLTTLRTIYPNN